MYDGHSASRVLDNLSRLIRIQSNRLALLLTAIGCRPNLNHATEDVGRGVSILVHLNAELGAKVGDDGGGRADGEEVIRDCGVGA